MLLLLLEKKETTHSLVVIVMIMKNLQNNIHAETCCLTKSFMDKFLSFRGAKVPDAPEGHKWQKVIHDSKVGNQSN